MDLTSKKSGEGIARCGETPSGDNAVTFVIARERGVTLVGRDEVGAAVKSVGIGMVTRNGRTEGGGSMKSVVGLPGESVVKDPVSGDVVGVKIVGKSSIVGQAGRVAVSGIGVVSIG